MQVKDLFKEKFVCMKNKLGAVVFWNEDALGYTNNIKEAGIFTEQQVKEHFNLRVLTSQQINQGEYRKYTHFATSLSDASKFFF